MRAKRGFVPYAALLMAGGLSLRADTVWTMAGPGWNGSLGSLRDNSLTLVATFPAGEKSMYFERKRVRSLEFNQVHFNSAQPADLGAQPSKRDSKTAPAAAPVGPDIVVKKFGEQKQCVVKEISSTTVQCGDESLPRGSVIRIIFGSQ